MAITHFNALADQIRGTHQPTTYAAVVARDVASTIDLVDVTLIDADDQGLLASEQAAWPARADASLPQRGDTCLVDIDNTGRPWVVAWDSPAY